MSFSHEYDVPVYVGTGAVLQSGDTSQLTAGQLGLFDNKNYKVITGRVDPKQSIIVASGSWKKFDKINKFSGGRKESKKSIDFLGQDIFEFHRSLPRRAQNEVWTLGWDGISTDPKSTISYEAGQSRTFRLRIFGEDVYGTFLRPIDRFIQVQAGCINVNDCADGNCSDLVNSKRYAQEIARIINEDPEFKYFVKASAISSDAVTATATHRLYHLSVIDNGDPVALAAVQTAYPNFKITRVDRHDVTSVYEFCASISSGAAGTATIATGGVTGVTITNAGRGYKTSSAVTFTGGGGTGATGTTTVQNGRVTGVTITAAGTGYTTAPTPVFAGADLPATFTALQPISLQICSVCPTGYTSTSASDVYEITRVVTAGTDLTTDAAKQTYANQLTTAYGGSNGKFLSLNGSLAVVEFQIAVGTVVAPIGSDTSRKARTDAAFCTAPAGSSVAWVAAGDRYKTTQTLTMTLDKVCGTNDRLAELQAFYANNSNVVPGSVIKSVSGTCNDTYQLQQYNNDCLVDGCLTEAVPSYDTVQSFDGYSWTVVVPTASTDTSVKVGVRIETAYEDTRYGGCSFSPLDYYSVRPLRMEIFEFDDSGVACVTPILSRMTQHSSMPTQSGEYVVREFLKAARYENYGEFFHDPRLREALDATEYSIIDPKKNYKIYYLKVKQNRGYLNHQDAFSPEIFEIRFFFADDVDTRVFEQTFEKVTSQFGVFLQDR